MKALVNANIFDFNNYMENCYILYDSSIVEIGCMDSFPGAGECHDMKGCLIMPGLIAGHTHIYSAFARGMSVPFNPRCFRDILEQLWWKLDAELDHEAVYYSGLVSAAEFIKNGVTTVIDHHASGRGIKGSLGMLKKGLCNEMGLRGVFCFETSDRFPVEECIEENLEFATSRSEKHAGMFGMHASMSLSEETLRSIGSVLGKLPVHIHTAESLEDEADCVERYGLRVIERLDKYGLLNKGSIAAHCIHIDRSEAELLSKAGVYAAVNPTSNMNNAVGLPDLKLLKSSGIKTILGNDGLGFNMTRDMLNLVFGMKHRLGDTMAFGLEELKEITGNGHELAGNLLGIKLGRICEGYKADMISVPYRPYTPINRDNAMGHVFFGLYDNFRPRDVICDGQMLQKDYKLAADIDGLYSEAAKTAQKVWKRLEQGGS